MRGADTLLHIVFPYLIDGFEIERNIRLQARERTMRAQGDLMETRPEQSQPNRHEEARITWGSAGEKDNHMKA